MVRPRGRPKTPEGKKVLVKTKIQEEIFVKEYIDNKVAGTGNKRIDTNCYGSCRSSSYSNTPR